jgi:hypothetical protein
MYIRSGTSTPLLDYEFPLATKYYSKNLPMLKNMKHPDKDHQVAVVECLVSEELLTRDVLTFKLTEKGVQEIKDIVEPSQNSETGAKSAGWQDNIPKYIIVGVIIATISGVLVLSVWHKIFGN